MQSKRATNSPEKYILAFVDFHSKSLCSSVQFLLIKITHFINLRTFEWNKSYSTREVVMSSPFWGIDRNVSVKWCRVLDMFWTNSVLRWIQSLLAWTLKNLQIAGKVDTSKVLCILLCSTFLRLIDAWFSKPCLDSEQKIKASIELAMYQLHVIQRWSVPQIWQGTTFQFECDIVS